MEKKNSGKTTIAPEVIYSIAKLTALGVDGVHSFAKVPLAMNSLFKIRNYEGIKVEIENNFVNIDLFLNFKSSYNVREVSRNIQTIVSREIFETIGFEVGVINVHVEDIIY